MRFIGNDPKTPRQTQVVASGTLSTGDTVVVNSDGTVSAAAGSDQSASTPVAYSGSNGTAYAPSTYDSLNQKVIVSYMDTGNSNYGTAVVGTISGSTVTFGTPVVYNSGTTTYQSITFDNSNNKVVIAYRDGGNSNHGTAIVGTVSGTSISFGSEVVFASAATNFTAATFDSSNNKVVITYEDDANLDYGTAIVGTVSGTSISFGTEATFNTTNTGGTACTFDSYNNKVFTAYRNASNNNYLTGVIGTVSGTSISFGTPFVINSSTISDFMFDVTFDSTNNKIIVAYEDNGNSSYGTIKVGEISGTSATFGAGVAWDAGADYIGCGYDSTNNKVIAVYRDTSNSNYGTVVSGTVSGNSISFDTPLVFEDSESTFNTVTFDANAGKSLISYRNVGDSNIGKASVFSPDSTNLTAENYIGTAKSGAADGNRAVVNIKGAIDENQSGLTAGQSYYVQNDGSLGTTAADPSVFAGTAVSATKLIVKG